jgi:hypothetical protein
VNEIGRVERELQRHVAAGRVADDVRVLHAESAHQRAAMRRMLRQAHVAGDAAAASAACAVIGDQAVPAEQRRLVEQWDEPVREMGGMDEHDRLTASAR